MFVPLSVLQNWSHGCFHISLSAVFIICLLKKHTEPAAHLLASFHDSRLFFRHRLILAENCEIVKNWYNGAHVAIFGGYIFGYLCADSDLFLPLF